MKHARKALSLALTLVMALCFALPAFAEGETPPLPVRITAEWDETVLFEDANLRPYFGPENVKVTVFFEDGSSRVQENWNGPFNNWLGMVNHPNGGVRSQRDYKTGEVTIYYSDFQLWGSYAEANNIRLGDFNLADRSEYRSFVPQATFQFPLNYLEHFATVQQTLPELPLNKATTAPGKTTAFSFTPKQNGQYTFTVQEKTSALHLYDDAFNRLSGTGSWEYTATLLAGKTYYILVPQKDVHVVAKKVGLAEILLWQPIQAMLNTPMAVLSGSIISVLLVYPVALLPITMPLSLVAAPFVGIYVFFRNLIEVIRVAAM